MNRNQSTTSTEQNAEVNEEEIEQNAAPNKEDDRRPKREISIPEGLCNIVWLS